jgi:itaconate CoA-transferase
MQPGPIRAPLAGLLVVALEQAVSAPLCTRHLADLGAKVIKVERPDGGDLNRHYDVVVRGQSSYHIWLNRGKESIPLDLRRADDRGVLDELLEAADVFVHNLGPGAADRLGLDWPRLHAAMPRLVGCAISGYGPDGPYQGRKAFDLLLQGESGLTSVTGSRDQPAKVGISIADIAAGMYALSAVLAALVERERTGQGRRIEISMLECLGEWMSVPLFHQIYGGAAPPRTGMRHNGIVPYGPFATADGGTVNLAVQTEGQWKRFCHEVLGRPDLVADPLFATNAARVRSRERLEPLIESVCSGMPRQVLLERLAAADVPYGDVNDVAGLVSHPQLRARGCWLEVETEDGSVRALAPPFGLEPLSTSHRVPGLGEHSTEIRRWLEERHNDVPPASSAEGT